MITGIDNWHWATFALGIVLIFLNKRGLHVSNLKSVIGNAYRTDVFNRYVSNPNIKHVGRYIGYGLVCLIAFAVIGSLIPDLVKAFADDVIVRFFYLFYKLMGSFMFAVSIMA